MGATIADESNVTERGACDPSDGGCLVLDYVSEPLRQSLDTVGLRQPSIRRGQCLTERTIPESEVELFFNLTD